MECIPIPVSVKHTLQTADHCGKMQTEVITQLLKKPKPIRNAKLGLKQYLRLTVSNFNAFGLFQQLNYNLSPGLQSVFYTDRLLYTFWIFLCTLYMYIYLSDLSFGL